VDFFDVLDTYGNSLTALWFAGVFTGALQGLRRRENREKSRVGRQLGAVAVFLRDKDDDPRWHAKVAELAHRGFSLKALLRFYRGLGTAYMPHWDASRHTTADVVRHAIIPESAAERSALATVMMDGRPTQPQKMVTHNWGNLFRDLVAAICADALGEESYSHIAQMMEQDMDLLEQWVEKTNSGMRTYWVCAFSVNQHCTICAQNPHGTCDSVTGEAYPLCSCDLPKSWNTTEPTTAKGASIDCEVNKFDAMVKMLAASDPGFEQVVAVDCGFELFTRAWCIAELAAAHSMGMRQQIKLPSAEALTQKAEDLRRLRIEDMEASRPEDKEEILSGISDTGAFNAKLRSLLLEDLLPAWSDRNGVERMERLARLARWLKVRKSQTSKDLACTANDEFNQECCEDSFV